MKIPASHKVLSSEHSKDLEGAYRSLSIGVVMKTIALLLGAGSLVAAAAMAQTSSSSAPAAAPTPPPFGPSVGPGRTLQTSDMTNPNPLIPADIYRNGAVAHQDLATFCLARIHLGRRAQCGGAGAACRAAASLLPAPAVPGRWSWETYQHRTELFPCNVNGTSSAPTPPQPWGALPKYVTTVSGSDPQLCSSITLPGGGPLLSTIWMSRTRSARTRCSSRRHRAIRSRRPTRRCCSRPRSTSMNPIMRTGIMRASFRSSARSTFRPASRCRPRRLR